MRGAYLLHLRPIVVIVVADEEASRSEHLPSGLHLQGRLRVAVRRVQVEHPRSGQHALPDEVAQVPWASAHPEGGAPITRNYRQRDPN